MTASQIFTFAHKLAKELNKKMNSYKAAFKAALKAVNSHRSFYKKMAGRMAVSGLELGWNQNNAGAGHNYSFEGTEYSFRYKVTEKDYSTGNVDGYWAD